MVDFERLKTRVEEVSTNVIESEVDSEDMIILQQPQDRSSR
jgi:hypothetical protein